LKAITTENVALGSVYSGLIQTIEASTVVMVTSRIPEDGLFQELQTDPDRLLDAGIETLKPIGDCLGPATIAAAVYEGHRFARELGEEATEIPYQREITELSTEFIVP
jgi:dimethylamine/trimethylamine dehydrogenase